MRIEGRRQKGLRGCVEWEVQASERQMHQIPGGDIFSTSKQTRKPILKKATRHLPRATPSLTTQGSHIT